jgi:hypothetical protein
MRDDKVEDPVEGREPSSQFPGEEAKRLGHEEPR